MLVTLEDFGQKSFVLCEFADSRLAAYFPTGPHQAGATTPELEGSVAVGGRSLGRSAGMGSPADDRPGAQARTSSSSSSVSAGMHTDENVHVTSGPAEVAAAEALLLYVKSLSFLQRGIDAVKIFLEARSRPGVPATASADVNDVVQWLRARFNDGYERADFARARCGEIPESAQHVDKLIFDKALEIVSTRPSGVRRALLTLRIGARCCAGRAGEQSRWRQLGREPLPPRVRDCLVDAPCAPRPRRGGHGRERRRRCDD